MPIPLVVLLHRLPRLSSKLLARTRTHIPAFPTMNSLAHSILKLSMWWTPSLSHPNKSTSGELSRSHSAYGPPIMNSSFVTQAKHIPNPMDLVLQVQTPQTYAYNFLSLWNTKQTSANSTYKLDFSPFSLKPWVLAQAGTLVALKLNHLA